MKYDFHVHDTLRVEYRILADGPPLAPHCARIARETRSAGGKGVLMALALVKWGARVLLTGNPIGDDAHGRFLLSELAKVPDLQFDPQIQPSFQTPYAILLQTDSPSVNTFLSPSACDLPLERRAKSDEARHFLGTVAFPPEVGSQNYPALLEALEIAAQAYLDWAGVNGEAATAFAPIVVQHYKEAFTDTSAILSHEEIEALRRSKR